MLSIFAAAAAAFSLNSASAQPAQDHRLDLSREADARALIERARRAATDVCLSEARARSGRALQPCVQLTAAAALQKFAVAENAHPLLVRAARHAQP